MWLITWAHRAGTLYVRGRTLRGRTRRRGWGWSACQAARSTASSKRIKDHLEPKQLIWDLSFWSQHAIQKSICLYPKFGFLLNSDCQLCLAMKIFLNILYYIYRIFMCRKRMSKTISSKTLQISPLNFLY